MAKLTVKDLNLRGKRVFVRLDYNVPLEEKAGEMSITDATRQDPQIPDSPTTCATPILAAI